jgi:hypothetical protein
MAKKHTKQDNHTIWAISTKESRKAGKLGGNKKKNKNKTQKKKGK